MSTVEIRHFHLFCGLGGGARGFNAGHARVGESTASFRCIGGVDCDAGSVTDFAKLTGAPGTALDLFDREQYAAWHGNEPPADWREAMPADIQRAAGGERPHIVFLSPPCKGFSGLLSQKASTSDRYQALNQLTLRGIHLMLEAWSDDPPEFVILENVPRIAHRGAALLHQIQSLLAAYGYATSETTHDCGELGGLAQHRKRFLLVARHTEKVPPFLYQPRAQRVRSVGEVLSELPLAGDIDSGTAMHRVPSLQWKTWVRLAFVEAGHDWRSLQRLRIQDGYLADYAIAPEADYHAGVLGVNEWGSSSGTIASRSGPTNGNFAVADPRRAAGASCYRQYGVKRFDDVAATVTGQRSPGQGPFAVADPRAGRTGARFNNVYRVVDIDHRSPAVTGGTGPSAGGLAVADPRPGMAGQRAHYQTGGHYGVVDTAAPAGVIAGHAKHDRGRYSVADPRLGQNMATQQDLPDATTRAIFCIQSLDGTWHRPFTTLELAALQGLVTPEFVHCLSGESDAAWRERIGNAVPPPAATAIASVMGETLLLAWAGETFTLDTRAYWVQPLASAVAVDQSPVAVGDLH